MAKNELEAIKVAIVTDDSKHISAHFGRSRHYIVATIKNGAIMDLQLRNKVAQQDLVNTMEGQADQENEHGHHHHHTQRHGRGGGYGTHSNHTRMIATIHDCSVLIARGMGKNAYNNLQSAGILPIVTTVVNIDEALQAYIESRLENHPERLH